MGCGTRWIREKDNDEMSDELPLLNARDLRRLAGQAEAKAPCEACSELVCPGWESLPGAFDRSRLIRIGTLRQVSDEEPTVSEHHPAGTNAWSPDAPIAPAYFPYNRCDVWRCASCERVFLRYTEYGGYYEDERIRELNAGLIDDTSA